MGACVHTTMQCVCAQLVTARGTGEEGVDDKAFCVLKIRAVKKNLNIKKLQSQASPQDRGREHKNRRSSFVNETKNGKHHFAVQGHL